MVSAESKWARFFLSTFAWVFVHMCDGIITISYNKEVLDYIFGKLFRAKIPSRFSFITITDCEAGRLKGYLEYAPNMFDNNFISFIRYGVIVDNVIIEKTIDVLDIPNMYKATIGYLKYRKYSFKIYIMAYFTIGNFVTNRINTATEGIANSMQ
ncbi:unnamed protein product [Caenorhabditis bovis]|uniref:7TM GPCR serpentine receptor class x (Srx) domain-containing protein n=1 Tax=Caenorhabditis bovis TaxID=2654633 RepID=A0A8S1EBU6_9PELO|nr:unnamed protein product [Caenorhabditis bovis]